MGIIVYSLLWVITLRTLDYGKCSIYSLLWVMQDLYHQPYFVWLNSFVSQAPVTRDLLGPEAVKKASTDLSLIHRFG